MKSQDKLKLKSGYMKNSMALADADRVFSQSLFCKKVYQLAKLNNFQPSFPWIAKTVGVTEKEVAVALDALLTLGLLKRTSSGYEVTSKKYYKEDTDPDTHLAFTEDLLGEPQERISGFANGAFATNQESILKFHEAIKKALDTFIEDSEKNPNKDFVYSMSFSSYKDSKESKESPS